MEEKHDPKGKNPAGLSRELVRWGYRLLLDREPEDDQVLVDKVTRLRSARELRGEILDSEEYKKKNLEVFVPTLSGEEPALVVEDVQSDAEMQVLLRHIQESWQSFGEEDPHWAVLTADRYKQENIESARERFIATGRRDVKRLLATLDRVGVNADSLKTCLEYGCGVGRVTRWLAPQFSSVVGFDISKSLLALAKKDADKLGLTNVTFEPVVSPSQLQNLPKVDLIFSVIVLQHNPPPLIRQILKSFMDALNPGGVAYFQLPTYRQGYEFRMKEYLTSTENSKSMEMHLLPQKEVFEIVRAGRARVMEVLEDDWIKIGYKEVSNTFVIQKDR